MLKFIYMVVLGLLLGQSVVAQYTVHVLNPYVADTCAWHRDSLRMGGNGVVGYYPGSSMKPEGGNWFYYTYQTRALSFTITNWCNASIYQGYVTYRYTISLDSALMKFPIGTTEIWISIPDTTKLPIITAQPPAGNKVVYFLSPWDIGAPSVQFRGMAPVKMKMDTSIALCGWFKYYYYGKTDSAQVKFINSLDSTVYSSAGIGPGNFIDLSGVLKNSDTVWVLPASLPNGPSLPNGAPSISKQYPNYSAQCQRTLLLGATLRDINGIQPGGHADFNKLKPACDGPNHDFTLPTLGMVMPNLGADGKPVLSPNSPCPVDSFNWFKTDTLDKIYTNAKCYNLLLTKNADGLYQYDTTYFYPLDGFKFLDPAGTIPNPWWTPGTDDKGFQHNYSFTMQLSAQFEYKKGQTFDFRGDDDVWVFINKRLAVDIGGVHGAFEGSVKLDSIAPLWGLTLGTTYEFDLFFCERWCCGSNFRMVTSLNLRTNSNLFTKQTLPGSGVYQYDMFQKITQSNLSCDFSQSIIDTQPAVVDFYITGPSFAQPTSLPSGTSYGGITIPSGNTMVRIDTAAVTDLLPGNYLITYSLRSDKSQTGTIAFTISALPADHFDVLPDTVMYDPKKDSPVDTIIIGMFDSLARAYAVLRDVNGTFIKRAANPAWTSRNPLVATVIQSPTDPSRCIITKAGAGATWVVVSDPLGALKPDSIRVVTLVLPKYPVIVSAIMLDANADLVPDMLSITVNDTFKTNQRLDSIVIAYRGITYSIPSANTTVSGTSINAPVTPATGIDGRPSGQAAIFMTTGDGPQMSSKNFTDGVGPAIIAASVMENDGGSPDTLFITFSEPLLQSTVAGNQLLLIKTGTIDTVSLSVLQVISKSSDSLFTVQVVASSGAQPKAGDRLRLLPGSKGGTVSDQSANKPHDLNQSVVLGLRPGPTAVVSAYYLDVNADGYLDRIIVGFKRPVRASDISALTAQWNIRPAYQYQTIAVDSIVKLNDSLYSLPLHGDAIRPVQPRTGVEMEIQVEYAAFPGIIRSLPVADSAGPVLLDPATLVYSNFPDSTILTVTFSENILPPGVRPFVLWSNKNGAQYQLNLAPDTVNGVMYTFHINPGAPYAAGGDSIWISTGTSPLVSDTSGYAQRNPLNHRVILHVTTQPPKWDVHISKNPFTPAQGFSTVISDSSQTPIMDPDQYTVTISIFDVIGNMVITKSMDQKDKFVPNWTYSWDGRNRNARLVGSGVYSGVISIFKNNTGNITKRIRIGIKR
jgi:fibro-slime domain-containing protein